ncbi:hypothetical protein [Deinococcus misasensis]|uniref:hypothetical protein n=1 Tax=Deinococcus misasensis TaxID=392413 RepID=UPI000552C062|nr:hypothetical protein [Deinococcus misasensis]
MLKALKWTSRKVLALLVAALVVGVSFAALEGLEDNTFFETVLAAGFFAFYLGGLPALLASGISDAFAIRLSKHRFQVALLIHLLGGILMVFVLLGFRSNLSGEDWLFVGLSLVAALVFFFMDEGLKHKRWLVN